VTVEGFEVDPWLSSTVYENVSLPEKPAAGV
jgi:hypothetical protein